MMRMNNQDASNKITIIATLSIILICYACSRKKMIHDHHVHLFSDSLIENLRLDPVRSFYLKGSNESYSNIDTVLRSNKAKRVWLISTGYGFDKNTMTEAELVSKVAKENDFLSGIVERHPKKLLPFYGIDLMIPEALEEIRRCHRDLNFYGIKLHFHSSKVNLRNKKTRELLKPIFEFLCEKHIPVLIHFWNHKSDFGSDDLTLFFNDILDSDESCKIIFAHMAGDGRMTSSNKDLVEQLIEINSIKKHQVYFETSGFFHVNSILSNEISNEEKLGLLNKIGFDRILFGTDYPAYSYEESVTGMTKIGLTEKQIEFILTNTID